MCVFYREAFFSLSVSRKNRAPPSNIASLLLLFLLAFARYITLWRDREIHVLVVPLAQFSPLFLCIPLPPLLHRFFLLHLSFSLTRLSIVFFCCRPSLRLPPPPPSHVFHLPLLRFSLAIIASLIMVGLRTGATFCSFARTRIPKWICIRRRRPAFCTGSISTREFLFG